MSALHLDQAGWLHGGQPAVRHVPSPNFNDRPDGTSISLVVIHNISLPPSQFGGGYIEQFFQNKLDPAAHPYFETIAALQVSAHVLITRCGEIIQFVSLQDRAWHAGQSCYAGQSNCNDYSIGIELEGSDDQPFVPVQYAVLRQLLALIYTAYPHTKGHITGHSDIAPGRKTDPGPYFDWQQLAN